MKWALSNDNSTVVNLIVYDGAAEYTPPDGLTLVSVNDWVQIGDSVKASEPSEPIQTAEQIEAYKETFFDQRLNGGIVVGGQAVKSNETSRVLLNGAVTRALLDNDPAKIYDFYAPDGTVIPLTNAQFNAIGLALAGHVQKCLAARAAIAGVTYASREEVAAAFEAAYGGAA